ncbi:MAG: potassium channel family protein [Planctomycetaceae bacterium]
MRTYTEHRYAILFYSLLATIVAGPLLETLGLDAGLLEVFLAATLLAAVMPVSGGTGRRVLLSGLIAVSAMRLGATCFDQPVASNVGLALWTFVALFAAAGAIRFAFRARSVDREHLYAALDAYLLFGVFLGVLYCTLERAWPASLAVAGQDSAEPLSLPTSIYFSFVTLVTLGYGDVLPRSEVARGLAVVEAVTGQLYLTVMIAHLVGLHVRTPTSGKEP